MHQVPAAAVGHKQPFAKVTFMIGSRLDHFAVLSKQLERPQK